MAAPVAPEPESGQITFEELAAQAAKGAAPPADLSKVLAPSSDDVPEELRGKPLSEVLKRSQALAEALRVSESARQAMRDAATVPVAAAPAPPAAPAPEPDLTDEQIKEMLEADQVGGTRKLIAMSVARAAKAFEARLEPLFKGSSSSAEATARATFKDEFELFGPEIADIVKNVPNPGILSSPQAWADIIGFVRGKQGNFEKLVEKRTTTASGAAAAAARGEQAAATGFTGAPTVRPPAAPSGAVLDPVEREIMATMGMSEAEWLKWK